MVEGEHGVWAEGPGWSEHMGRAGGEEPVNETAGYGQRDRRRPN